MIKSLSRLILSMVTSLGAASNGGAILSVTGISVIGLPCLAAAEVVPGGDVAAGSQQNGAFPPPGHGPHAGTILGSGELVIELVRTAADRITIHLLDRDWVSVDLGRDATNPILRIKAGLFRGGNGNAIDLMCRYERFEFNCELPSKPPVAKGDRLEIAVVKQGTIPGTLVKGGSETQESTIKTVEYNF